MLKGFLGFILGGVICGGAAGWLVWEFKPSSIEASAFSAVTDAFDAEAAKLKAEYESETKVLQQQFDEAEERVSDAEERTVSVRARHDMAVSRLGKEVESKSNEIAALKESESQAEAIENRMESLEALVKILHSENDLYVEINADLMEQLSIKDALIATLEDLNEASHLQSEVLMRMVESRDNRIEQLDGRKFRIGPGASAGWSPITGGWGSVTVGIVALWG